MLQEENKEKRVIKVEKGIEKCKKKKKISAIGEKSVKGKRWREGVVVMSLTDSKPIREHERSPSVTPS